MKRGVRARHRTTVQAFPFVTLREALGRLRDAGHDAYEDAYDEGEDTEACELAALHAEIVAFRAELVDLLDRDEDDA